MLSYEVIIPVSGGTQPQNQASSSEQNGDTPSETVECKEIMLKPILIEPPSQNELVRSPLITHILLNEGSYKDILNLVKAMPSLLKHKKVQSTVTIIHAFMNIELFLSDIYEQDHATKVLMNQKPVEVIPINGAIEDLVKFVTDKTSTTLSFGWTAFVSNTAAGSEDYEKHISVFMKKTKDPTKPLSAISFVKSTNIYQDDDGRWRTYDKPIEQFFRNHRNIDKLTDAIIELSKFDETTQVLHVWYKHWKVQQGGSHKYKGRSYKVRTGQRGGKYILVNKKKKYLSH